MQTLHDQRGIRWAAIAVALATILAYVPALNAPFVWDDALSIRNTPTIGQLWHSSAPLPEQSQSAVAGRPVVGVTLALNSALNHLVGVDVRPDPDGPEKTVGYHLVNLLFHLLCGALLFGVLRRTLRRRPDGEPWPAFDGLDTDVVAIAVTAVWLLHPIQSEAILYVVQRTEVIVSVCYLGTLYASIRAWDATLRRARMGWYAAAIVICLLGMGSKEVMITAPLAVMLYDRAFRSTSWRRLLSARGSYYLLLAATCSWAIVLIAGGPRSNTVGFHLGISWYAYLYSQAWAILRYIRLIVWPAGLTLDYGLNPIVGPGGVPGLVVLTTFGVATLLAWTRVERWGWFGFLGAWFFLLLAPSSSVVPIRTEIAAERRIYLAMAAVLVLLAIGVAAFARRARFPVRRIGWVFAGLCAVLVAATIVRGRTYMRTEGMWRDVVAKAPGNPRGYENLAGALTREDPPEEAEAEALLRTAIAVDSSYLPPWDALVNIIMAQGRLAEARALIRRLLVVAPAYGPAFDHMGILLAEQGDPTGAIPYLERAVAVTPTAQSLIDLGIVYAAVGRPEDAIKALQRSIYLDPSRTDALSHLGAVLTANGMADDAVPYLEDAVRRDPASGLSFARLSQAYAETGRAGDAIVAAREAVTKSGSDERVYAIAGQAMIAANRRMDAEQYLAQAVKLRPDDAVSRAALAQLVAEGRP